MMITGMMISGGMMSIAGLPGLAGKGQMADAGRPQIYPAGGDGVNRRVRAAGATRSGAARGEHFTPIRRNMPDFAAGAFAKRSNGALGTGRKPGEWNGAPVATRHNRAGAGILAPGVYYAIL